MVDASDPATRPPLSPLVWFSKIDRKVWLGGGVGGLFANLTMSATKAYLHFDVGAYLQPFLDLVMPPTADSPHPLSALALLTVAFSVLFGYIVPAAYSDIYKRINAKVIALAVVDPSTPVSQSKIAAEIQVMSPVKSRTPDPDTTGLY